MKAHDAFPWSQELVMNSEPIEYRNIRDFVGYRVGSDGSVWSCLKKGPGGKGKGRGAQTSVISSEWRRLKPRTNPNGYVGVTLCSAGKTVSCLIHRLVLTAFEGDCPPGMEACHNDGDRSNNSRSNLRWDTPQRNWADRERHGRGCKGSRNPSVKLTPQQALVIWHRCKSGEPQRKVARDFGVSHGHVGNIMSGRLWSHLTAEDRR